MAHDHPLLRSRRSRAEPVSVRSPSASVKARDRRPSRMGPEAATMGPMALPAPHVPAPLQLRIATSSGTGDRHRRRSSRRGGATAATVGPTIDGVVEVRPERGSSSGRGALSEGAIWWSARRLGERGAAGPARVGVGHVGEWLHPGLGGHGRRPADHLGLGRASPTATTGAGSPTKSGKVTVEETGTADISTVSGTIRIERVTGAVQARTVSGGVSIVVGRARAGHGPDGVRRGAGPAARRRSPHGPRIRPPRDGVRVRARAMT